jgi:predicted flap endonuclease-1-like 5' DNA nuclease
MDLITICGAGACGALLGGYVGFLRGRRTERRRPRADRAWRIRLKSRDDDVAAAEERTADAAVRLEAVTAELAATRRRLHAAEPGSADAAPPARARRNDAAAPVDDLTLVHGIGPGDAAIFEASGITSFDALARLGADGAVIPEDVADRLADRLSEWAAEARRLAGPDRRDPG